MATYRIIKLYFTSPLHLSRGQTEEYDRAAPMLHADTISGALASAFTALFPDEDVKEFMHSYKVSSAFPFSTETLLFPKPMTRLPVNENTHDLGFAKKIKKTEYVDQKLFEAILNMQEIELESAHFYGNMMVSKKSASFPFYKKDVQQRVMVPRSGDGDSVPYYIERTWFKEGTGLFFLVEVGDNEQQLKSCMHFLADSGLGTDKSVGNGQFKLSEPIIEEIDLKVPEKSDMQLNLALYCPVKTEISLAFLENSSYNLELRGGFLAGSSNDKIRHLRKKKVYMFSCGAVFPANELKGKILDLSPEWDSEDMHPVYRDGRGFFIPIKSTN
jgi:CRISPR-associated protein Csm4